MLNINKRQSEIYHRIKEVESINVSELISMFDVSPATIRKDLTLLEQSGLVFRTHGEVHIAAQKELITPFETRSTLHAESKKAIAQLAVQQIENGDSIILDSGSTTLEIAKLLDRFERLTVITNSLPAAMALSNTQATVLLVGGTLLGKNLSVQGPDSERYLENIEADKAFISSSGVRRDLGLVASNSWEASLKHRMIESARVTYACIDSAKFSINSIELFANFSELDCIITDKEISDPAQSARLKSLGTKILIASK